MAFRRLRFGTVPFEFTDAQVMKAERFLVGYVRSCQQVAILTDVSATLEVFQLAKAYIGQDFKQWLTVNYNNGSGVRAPLCRAIAAWHHRTLSDRGLLSEVKRDLNRLSFIEGQFGQLAQMEVFNHTPAAPDVVEEVPRFTTITDKTFFEILALLGPELTAHFCLSMNGVKALN